MERREAIQQLFDAWLGLDDERAAADRDSARKVSDALAALGVSGEEIEAAWRQSVYRVGIEAGEAARRKYYCQACGERFDDRYAAGALAPAECPRCGEERRIVTVKW